MRGLEKGAFIIFILTFFMLVSSVDVLFATHEVDHRYTIFGYVRDEKGLPISDARVIATDKRIGDGSTTFTRKDGSYEVILHLHNENLGDEIAVSAHGEEKRATASFDPSDKFSDRRMRVDFGPDVAESTEKPWIYYSIYSIGFILLAGTLIYLGVSRKRKERHEKPKGKERKKKR